jgi:hypothetical protein
LPAELGVVRAFVVAIAIEAQEVHADPRARKRVDRAEFPVVNRIDAETKLPLVIVIFAVVPRANSGYAATDAQARRRVHLEQAAANKTGRQPIVARQKDAEFSANCDLSGIRNRLRRRGNRQQHRACRHKRNTVYKARAIAAM